MAKLLVWILPLDGQDPGISCFIRPCKKTHHPARRRGRTILQQDMKHKRVRHPSGAAFGVQVSRFQAHILSNTSQRLLFGSFVEEGRGMVLFALLTLK